MELIQQLVSQLGVDESQAKGGAGMLFQLAKDKLDDGEFSQIASAVPGLEDMLQAAPSLAGGGGGGGGGGLLSKVMSMFGGGGGSALGSLGGLASLVGGFSQLGLGGDMIGKFVPVVMSFVQEQGGDQAKGLLESVFK